MSEMKSLKLNGKEASHEQQDGGYALNALIYNYTSIDKPING